MKGLLNKPFCIQTTLAVTPPNYYVVEHPGQVFEPIVVRWNAGCIDLKDAR